MQSDKNTVTSLCITIAGVCALARTVRTMAAGMNLPPEMMAMLKQITDDAEAAHAFMSSTRLKVDEPSTLIDPETDDPVDAVATALLEKFSSRLGDLIVARLDISQLAESCSDIIDMSDLAREIDLSDLAREIDLSDLSNEIDVSEIDVSPNKVADHIDTEVISERVATMLKGDNEFLREVDMRCSGSIAERIDAGDPQFIARIGAGMVGPVARLLTDEPRYLHTMSDAFVSSVAVRLMPPVSPARV